MTTSVNEAAEITPEYRLKRKRAIWSAWAGFFIDSYSIFLPSIALLPAMIYFQGDLTTEQAALFAGATFAATLLGRPVGAVLFGRLADKLGRQRIGTITIYGFAAVTTIIGLLPGGAVLGAPLAMALLVSLRFVDGIFLGGEYTAATPLALEYAPRKRRGLVGGLVQSSASAGIVAISLIVGIVLLFSPAGNIDSPYVQWGWRIPFFIGAIGAYFVARYLRRSVTDSDTWQKAARSRSPLRDMLRGDSGRAFVQVLVMMTGVFFAINVGTSVLPQLLLSIKGFSPANLSAATLIMSLVSIGVYIFFGWLSDKIGRKPALLIGAAIYVVVAPASITLIASKQVQDLGVLVLLTVLIGAAGVASVGVLPAYINERFATAVRSSGWGVGYSTAVIIPAFFSLYLVGLSKIMPAYLGPGTLMIIGAVFLVVGTLVGPETRGSDLSTVGARKQQSLG